MRHITWYSLLALGVLAAPLAGQAQGPQPKVREIATFPGTYVGGAVRMPNGRIIVYAGGDSLFAYDPASKRRTFIASHFDDELSISNRGDRLAFTHLAEDGNDYIWSVPIDPTTGAPTGTPQRASMSAGDVPALSRDGKLIAFALWTPRGNDLAVVSATGGPERVLAKYASGIGFTSWSADGKWILVDVGGRDSIQRVPAAGGPSQKVISYSGRGEGVLNGQIAVFSPDLTAREDGRIAYATTSGTTGTFRIPPGARWSGDYMGVPSQPKLFGKTTRPSTAHLLNLADGTMHQLLPDAALSRSASWSPDGSRIAVQDSSQGGWEITVVNPDGSQARHYPVAAYANLMRWSPNGQMLAYYTGGRIGLDVLDLATARTRRVSTASQRRVAGFIWRPDSRSIVLTKESMDGNGASADPTEEYETSIDGVEHVLRDLQATLPGYFSQGYITDRQLIVGKNMPPFDQALVSSDGAAVRKLSLGARKTAFGVSQDGTSLLFLLGGPGRNMSIELLTAAGEPVRTLSLPFVVDNRNRFPPFHPDGQHVILVGKTPGESVSKIFLVPLNGDAPRTLATLPGSAYANGRLDLSPDGKSLVFTTEGAPTSAIYEIDMSPILRTMRAP